MYDNQLSTDVPRKTHDCGWYYPWMQGIALEINSNDELDSHCWGSMSAVDVTQASEQAKTRD